MKRIAAFPLNPALGDRPLYVYEIMVSEGGLFAVTTVDPRRTTLFRDSVADKIAAALEPAASGYGSWEAIPEPEMALGWNRRLLKPEVPRG